MRNINGTTTTTTTTHFLKFVNKIAWKKNVGQRRPHFLGHIDAQQNTEISLKV